MSLIFFLKKGKELLKQNYVCKSLTTIATVYLALTKGNDDQMKSMLLKKKLKNKNKVKVPKKVKNKNKVKVSRVEIFCLFSGEREREYHCNWKNVFGKWQRIFIG